MNIELEKIHQLIDSEVIIDLKYNGKVCHWREGDLNYNVLYLTESQIEFIKLTIRQLKKNYKSIFRRLVSRSGTE